MGVGFWKKVLTEKNYLDSRKLSFVLIVWDINSICDEWILSLNRLFSTISVDESHVKGELPLRSVGWS